MLREYLVEILELQYCLLFIILAQREETVKAPTHDLCLATVHKAVDIGQHFGQLVVLCLHGQHNDPCKVDFVAAEMLEYLKYLPSSLL